MLVEPDPPDGGAWVPTHLPFATPQWAGWAGRPLADVVAAVGGLFLAQEARG